MREDFLRLWGFVEGMASSLYRFICCRKRICWNAGRWHFTLNILLTVWLYGFENKRRQKSCLNRIIGILTCTKTCKTKQTNSLLCQTSDYSWAKWSQSKEFLCCVTWLVAAVSLFIHEFEASPVNLFVRSW